MMAFDINGIELPDGGPICDTCISQLIEEGKLVEIPRAPVQPLSDEMTKLIRSALSDN